jgi:putative hydrolase of the HAD superfamily
VVPALSRPEVVFLDVGDTLVRADPSWAEVYAIAFPEFGVRVSPDAFHRAMAEAFVDWEGGGPFEATEEASYQRIKELDGRVFAALGYPDLPDAFYRRVDDAFRQRSSWLVFPDVVPAVDALRAAGLRLAVISNWTWAAPELLHDLELAAHFEALVISSRVGFQKPHRGIFEHALEVMRVAPERAVHVGDSFSADVLGARSVGITPVLIDRRIHEPGHTHGRRPSDDEVPVVGDLLELADLLGVPRPLAIPS